jgi:poly(beta-D-mannuronate) lyase
MTFLCGRCRVLVILVFVFSAVRMHAAEFHVATAAEIATAMASAAPGDTLTMKPDTWMDARIVFAGNGTADKPILLRAPFTGSVVVTGASNLRIAGDYLVVDGLTFRDGYSPSGAIVEFRSSSGAGSNHCRLTNTTITGFNPADKTTDYKWVSLYGTYNRVDHCAISGKTHSGTTLVVWLDAQPNYHRIDHNYFGPRPPLGVNGGETIRVGTSDWSMYDSFTTVEWNLFDQCNGEIEIISSKSCGNVYRWNTLIDCEGTLTLRHGNRCRVEGNFFFGNGRASTGGIRIIGEDHVVINNYLSGLTGTSMSSSLSMVDGIVDSPLNGYFQVKRALVAFNTLVSNRVNITVGAGKDADNVLPPLDCTISNNIVYGATAPLITLTDSPINMVWQGNVFYGATVGLSPLPPSNRIIDPRLAPVDTEGVRHLLGSSPAIDSAAGSYPAVLLDMDGQARDSLKDVGADEFSTAPATVHPVRRSDVGPVTAVDETGGSSERGDRSGDGLPGVLDNPFPNPCNPQTEIRFQISSPSFVTLRVYDLLGRQASVLVSNRLPSGTHTVTFDGRGLPSGTYLCCLVSGTHVETKRIMLLK